MSNYKLVLVEPTPKMLQVWKSMYGYSRYDKYKAMLVEAPIINIVATKNEQGQIVSVTLQDEDHRILEVIAEADVQGKPDVSALVEALEELVDLVEDIRQGEYIPDSFTTQPARIALDAYRKGGGK